MIEILYFSGCPHHKLTVDLAREVVGELGIDAEILGVAVESLEAAERLRFIGSPSVRVNGRDIEADARERTDFALSCRIYGSAGVPPRELLVEALRAA